MIEAAIGLIMAAGLVWWIWTHPVEDRHEKAMLDRLINDVKASESDMELIGFLTDYIADEELMLAVCWAIVGDLDLKCKEVIRRPPPEPTVKLPEDRR